MKSFGLIRSTFSWTTVALVCAGSTARAADLTLSAVGAGVVDGLAVMRDLEPIDAAPAPRFTPKLSATTFRTEARASTPDLDRSKSYSAVDPFASSRVVLPLLVEDLVPDQASVMRPMTGRSVGARPSLPLARPGSR